MEIIGKLIKILPETSGTSEKGNWVRGGFVIEYQDGDYPTNAAFTLFGENRINMAKNLPMGSMVRVQFSVRSREYQERWYTDLSCFRIEPYGQSMPYQQGNPAYAQAYQPAPAPAYGQVYPQQGFQPTAQPAYQAQTPVYQPAPQQQQPPVYPEAQPQEGSFGDMQSVNQEDDLPF